MLFNEEFTKTNIKYNVFQFYLYLKEGGETN